MKRITLILLLLLIQTAVLSQDKGSYFTISGNLGFQGFKYSPMGISSDGFSKLGLGYSAGIGYMYFFTPYFGISTGVEISYFATIGGYNESFKKERYYDLGDQIDDDFNPANPNMPFNLRARLQNWEELQQGYTFNVPFMFIFQHKLGKTFRHAMYYGIGAKVQIPVISTTYKVLDGENTSDERLNISGYYPDWHMEVAAGGTSDPQVPQHGYGKIHNPNEALGWKGNARVKTSYAATAEIGYLYKINKRLSFSLGAYFDYGLNNIKEKEDNDPLMIANNPYHSGYNEWYVGKGIKYNGLMNSDRTDNIHLLAYGVKVGLRIRLGKAAPEEIYPAEDQIQIPPCDTIYIRDTIYQLRVDTVHVIEKQIDPIIIKEELNKQDTIYIETIIPEKETPIAPLKENIMFYGRVVEGNTKTIIPYAQVQITNEDTKHTETIIADSAGRFAYEIDKRQNYTTIAHAKAHREGTIKFNISKEFRANSFYKDIELEKLTDGHKFVLENLYYDFDKSDIRPDAAIELDKLVRIMEENPTLKIELSSHTDSRGSDEYNLKLSEKRAASAVKYVISKGISADRIISKGYGETKPVNECTNGVECSEKQHQENRRTEVLVKEI
jgi:outer membrane protein OmpA-like peptidoglycan-associated protein